jgi:hypothetical protein
MVSIASPRNGLACRSNGSEFSWELRAEIVNISNETRVIVAANTTAAGQTAINGRVIDLSSARGVRGLAVFGDVAATSVLTLRYQSGTLADGSDMADVAGASATHTATATNADNKAMSLDVVGLNPLRRYGRFVLTRTTADAAVQTMLAEVYDLVNTPATGGDVVRGDVVRG